ncbi:MAG: aminotransferase class III-fold pyridoxal phosphate-dependent enzyme [Zestosphaera sp.]
MSVDPYLDLRSKYIMKGAAVYHPITIERGKNALLYDVNGKKYLDFTCGIGVTSLGHANPELVKAAEEQLRKLWHICFMVANYRPYVELAEKLAKIAPGTSEKQVLLQNSGSEATENAVKIARQVTGKAVIVSYENSFHGRGTYGFALATTGKYKPYKVGLEPIMPGVEFVPYPYCYRCPFKHEYPQCGLACLDYIKKWFIHARIPPERIAAFIMEMIQGEGGFVVPPTDYVKELKKFLDENGIVIIGDDIFYNKFKNAFVELAKKIKIGYGLDETSEMGPIASKKYRESIIKWIETGLSEGAKLVLDGREYKNPEYPNGFYLGPTILEGVTPDMKIAREEIFGPVANLLRADSLDEAIEWVNNNKYHHTAAIFTRSGKWAREFIHGVYVGNVGVNIGIAAPVGWFPFGGKKLAGLGSHHPQMDVVDFFTDRKIVITRWW